MTARTSSFVALYSAVLRFPDPSIPHPFSSVLAGYGERNPGAPVSSYVSPPLAWVLRTRSCASRGIM